VLVDIPVTHPNIVDGGNVWRWRYWGLNSSYGTYDGVSNFDKVQAEAIAYVTYRATNEGPRVAGVNVLKP
jgi:hypothetical protein